MIPRRRLLRILAGLCAVPWIGDAAAAAPAQRRQQVRADRIVVLKSERRLYLYRGDTVLKSYAVALGRNPQGHKTRPGDGRTPEGIYRIDGRNPKSKFHRSLHISYPNADDLRRAKAARVRLASDIVIHGLDPLLAEIGAGADHAAMNWTNGCIAVTNEEIEEIWRLVPDGTLVDIRP